MQGPRKDTAGAWRCLAKRVSSYRNQVDRDELRELPLQFCCKKGRLLETRHPEWRLGSQARCVPNVYEENGYQPVRFPSAPSKNDNTEKNRTYRGLRTDMLRTSRCDRDMKVVKRCGISGQRRSTWRKVNFVNRGLLQVRLFAHVDASTRHP